MAQTQHPLNNSFQARLPSTNQIFLSTLLNNTDHASCKWARSLLSHHDNVGGAAKEKVETFLRQCDSLVFVAAQQPIDTSVYIYTIVTPIIILIGLIGNSLCIKIFTQRRMRRQTTSIYFAALSVTDLLVLLVYVLPEWINRGLTVITSNSNLQFYAKSGLCHCFLYFSYTLRFLSIWMLVTSTIERYIGVCHPLLRRKICSNAIAQKIIGSVAFISTLACIWKPVLSGVELLNGTPTCTALRGFSFVSHVLDSIYAAFLSIIPSVFILVFNVLISRRLLVFRRSETCISHKEMIGMQFAILLVLISTCFLLLTWPYYICWFRHWYLFWLRMLPLTKYGSNFGLLLQNITTESQFSLSQQFDSDVYISDSFTSAIYLTRALFYVNYSINFFLYTFSSQYFRSEMKRIFTLKNQPSQTPTLEGLAHREVRCIQGNEPRGALNDSSEMRQCLSMRRCHYTSRTPQTKETRLQGGPGIQVTGESTRPPIRILERKYYFKK